MAKSKTAFDYFSPRQYNLTAHSQILSVNEDEYVRRCKAAKRKNKIMKKRSEILVKMIQVFSETFDVEFPDVSMQVKSTLFEQWKSVNYNKELVQADIQIKNLLAEIGNARALNRWIEIYKAFKKGEES